jgi:malate dehydrogenase (quinone)
MVDLLARCFPDRIEGWKPRIRQMIPSYGTKLSDDPAAAAASLAATAEVLHLSN